MSSDRRASRKLTYAATYFGLVALSIALIIVAHRSSNLVWPILYAIVLVSAFVVGSVVRRERRREEREADQREMEEFRARLHRLTD